MILIYESGKITRPDDGRRPKLKIRVEYMVSGKVRQWREQLGSVLYRPAGCQVMLCGLMNSLFSRTHCLSAWKVLCIAVEDAVMLDSFTDM